MRFFVSVYSSYNFSSGDLLATFDVSDSVQFGTQLHGGFSDISFSLQGGKWASMLRYRGYLAKYLRLYDDYGRCLFEGEITSTTPSQDGIDVRGLGLYYKAKHELQGLIYPVGTKVYEIVNDCIDLVPAWASHKAHIADATFTLDSDYDFSGDVKVADALEEVLKFGYQDADFRGVYFFLGPGRIPYLIPEPDAGALNADWYLNLSELLGGSTTLSLTSDQIFNKIYGRYDDGAEDSIGPTPIPTPAQDTMSQNLYGVRTGFIDGGKFGYDMAIAIRDAALVRYRYPRQEFQATVSGFVKNSLGANEYPYMIRAGTKAVAVDDPMITPNFAGGVSGYSASLFIVKTTYSAKDNKLSMVFGSPDSSFEYAMTRLGFSGGVT